LLRGYVDCDLYRNEWGGEFLGEEENQEEARNEECNDI